MLLWGKENPPVVGWRQRKTENYTSFVHLIKVPATRSMKGWKFSPVKNVCCLGDKFYSEIQTSLISLFRGCIVFGFVGFFFQTDMPTEERTNYFSCKELHKFQYPYNIDYFIWHILYVMQLSLSFVNILVNIECSFTIATFNYWTAGKSRIIRV